MNTANTVPVDDGAPLLEARGLVKHFGGARVINGIDLAVGAGEIRCVIGPNGAGKSTFFKLLTGELAPSGGDVRFMGRDLAGVLPHQRIRMGMSIKFQIPGIFPELTVQEHLALALSRRRTETVDTDAVESLLARFHLADEHRVQAGRLSHGRKQWLEIAMAVALGPSLLLLDEPVAGLSVEETEITGELVKALRAQGLTVLVVEHDMTFVRQIASRVTVLHGGRVFADGSLEQVLARDDVAEIYLGTQHA